MVFSALSHNIESKYIQLSRSTVEGNVTGNSEDGGNSEERTSRQKD